LKVSALSNEKWSRKMQMLSHQRCIYGANMRPNDKAKE
jgi:hypothetical protein